MAALAALDDADRSGALPVLGGAFGQAGSVRSGGDERGLQARTGRIGWRELLAP